MHEHTKILYHMIVVLGSDHAGFEMKDYLARSIREIPTPRTVVDVGCPDSITACDYPKIASALCDEMARQSSSHPEEDVFGVLVCGTGIGISIAANKMRGIRCALVHSVETARMARLHNDANVIAFGGKVLSFDVAKEALQTFLTTQTDPSERHRRRVDQLGALDDRQ